MKDDRMTPDPLAETFDTAVKEVELKYKAIFDKERKEREDPTFNITHTYILHWSNGYYSLNFIETPSKGVADEVQAAFQRIYGNPVSR
jgi:hypothetical protein